jgi:hypothetical protein
VLQLPLSGKKLRRPTHHDELIAICCFGIGRNDTVIVDGLVLKGRIDALQRNHIDVERREPSVGVIAPVIPTIGSTERSSSITAGRVARRIRSSSRFEQLPHNLADRLF